MEPTLATIIGFAGNFAPRSWAFCDGQLLPISQYSALFSLLGTIYGGDGRTTFGLPDLRGRVSLNYGNGPGLSPRKEGQKGGTEYNVLNVTQLPAHNHSASGRLKVSNLAANSNNPENNTFAVGSGTDSGGTPVDIHAFGSSPVAQTTDNPLNITVGNTGGNQQVNNIMPSLCVNYIICLQGVFPSRS